ncbi:hypothetical protein ANCDUO_05231, partial [Ancylostoma duodenale]
LKVLHETSAIDQERCEPDFLRPLTACGGDSSRSFTYLEWVHENQARRMRSRSEWCVNVFLSPAIPSKSSSHAHERDVFTLASIPGPFTFTQENDKKDPEASGMASLIQRKPSKVGPRVERLSQSKKGRQLLEHSLDSQDPPILPSQRAGGKPMYARPFAHSLGGETWLVEVISDEIWKKKRSMKKKH